MKESVTLQASLLKRRLLSGSAWALAGKLLTTFTGLLLTALLARLLSPEEMGAYFLTFSLVSAAAILARIGLGQTVVRLVAESVATNRPYRARAAVKKSFLITTASAILVAALLTTGSGQWLALYGFESKPMSRVMGLAAVWVIVVTLQGLFSGSFRGFHDIRLATIFGGLVSTLLSSGLFALLWAVQGYSDLTEVITLSLLTGAMSVTIAGLLLRKKVKELGREGDLTSKELLTIALPILITNLTLFVLTRADLWIMGMFYDERSVAIYGAAARLVMIVAMPLSLVNWVVPPLIAEFYALGKIEELENTLRSTATLAGIPAFTVLAAFILMGGPIISIVYGEFYRQGLTVLVILSIGQMVSVAAGSCGLTLMMTGNQTTIMRISLLCALLNISGALLVVRHYGSVGVATTVAFTIALQNCLMLRATRRRTGMWTHFGLIRISDTRKIPQCYRELN